MAIANDSICTEHAEEPMPVLYRNGVKKKLGCKTRYSKKKFGTKKRLNSLGLALSRIVAFILETYQTEDGDVEVPEVLKSFMGVDKI